MDLNDIDDDTLDQLADRTAERLDPGAYGDRVVLSRRQLVGVATGVLGTGTLLSLGVDPAAAQAAGSVGTSSDPVDVFAYDLDVQNGLAMNGTDITNAGSVSTESVGVDVSASNTTDVLLNSLTTSAEIITQDTTNVSTTAVEIIDPSTGGGIMLVVGFEQGSSFTQFTDVLVSQDEGGNAPTVIGSSTAGSPASRTYDDNGGASVSLEMAANTYDVSVVSIFTKI